MMTTIRFTTARSGNRVWAIGLGIVFAALPLLAQRGAAPTRDQLPQPPGDSVNGRLLFESNKCLDCHRIDGNGSRLGPDLSDIGARRSPDLLQQAIVAPDDEVLPE